MESVHKQIENLLGPRVFFFFFIEVLDMHCPSKKGQKNGEKNAIQTRSYLLTFKQKVWFMDIDRDALKWSLSWNYTLRLNNLRKHWWALENLYMFHSRLLAINHIDTQNLLAASKTFRFVLGATPSTHQFLCPLSPKCWKSTGHHNMAYTNLCQAQFGSIRIYQTMFSH